MPDNPEGTPQSNPGPEHGYVFTPEQQEMVRVGIRPDLVAKLFNVALPPSGKTPDTLAPHHPVPPIQPGLVSQDGKWITDEKGGWVPNLPPYPDHYHNLPTIPDSGQPYYKEYAGSTVTHNTHHKNEEGLSPEVDDIDRPSGPWRALANPPEYTPEQSEDAPRVELVSIDNSLNALYNARRATEDSQFSLHSTSLPSMDRKTLDSFEGFLQNHKEPEIARAYNDVTALIRDIGARDMGFAGYASIPDALQRHLDLLSTLLIYRESGTDTVGQWQENMLTLDVQSALSQLIEGAIRFQGTTKGHKLDRMLLQISKAKGAETWTVKEILDDWREKLFNTPYFVQSGRDADGKDDRHTTQLPLRSPYEITPAEIQSDKMDYGSEIAQRIQKQPRNEYRDSSGREVQVVESHRPSNEIMICNAEAGFVALFAGESVLRNRQLAETVVSLSNAGGDSRGEVLKGLGRLHRTWRRRGLREISGIVVKELHTQATNASGVITPHEFLVESRGDVRGYICAPNGDIIQMGASATLSDDQQKAPSLGNKPRHWYINRVESAEVMKVLAKARSDEDIWRHMLGKARETLVKNHNTTALQAIDTFVSTLSGQAYLEANNIPWEEVSSDTQLVKEIQKAIPAYARKLPAYLSNQIYGTPERQIYTVEVPKDSVLLFAPTEISPEIVASVIKKLGNVQDAVDWLAAANKERRVVGMKVG